MTPPAPTLEGVKVSAQVTRSGEWWAVEVSEVPGVFTQAATLAEVPTVVADAVAVMTGCGLAEVFVTVQAERTR